MKRPEPTIAAVATAPGRGGIGIVRVSGADLRPMAEAILGRLPRPRYTERCSFRDAAGRPIDDGLALYFPAPNSYTGEDVLELHGHGGPVVMSMLLARCLQLGARPAQPGEFTRRAFLNEKMDLAQAEAVADIIDAASEQAVRCALRSLRGEFSEAIHRLVRELIELRMLVEATLDFPEEDIDVGDRIAAERRLLQLREQLARALAQAQSGSALRHGLTVVLAGQPNVGKSSLLNRLAGEELAIVTAVPGTTRDALRELIQIEGVPIHIVDTAGLRPPGDEVEALGIERTWEMIERADLLLLVVDARVGVTPEDETIVSRLPARLQRVTVHNKIDLCAAPMTASTAHERIVYLSARTGEGLDRLRRLLLETAGWQSQGEDVFMARERHLHALLEARSCLERAGVQLAQTELLAEELRLAQRALGSITGEFGADDLLGEIFSRFCIGK